MKKKDIVEIFNELSLEGYDLELHQEGSKLGLSITKEDLKTIRLDSFYINSTCEVSKFKSLITVKKIENILSPILREAGIIGGKEGSLMVTSSLYNLEKKAYNDYFLNFAFDIIDSKSVLELFENFKIYIKTIAEPFYEKWSDLKRLNTYLDQLPQQEVSTVLGQGGTFKKAIVFKLCKNPKYEDYFRLIYCFYTNRFKENPNGDNSYKQWNEVAILMKEALDNLSINDV